MSNERSPREVCSTTIGTSGIYETSVGTERWGKICPDFEVGQTGRRVYRVPRAALRSAARRRSSLCSGARGSRHDRLTERLGRRMRRELVAQELPDLDVQVAAERPLRGALVADLAPAVAGARPADRPRRRGVLAGEAG